MTTFTRLLSAAPLQRAHVGKWMLLLGLLFPTIQAQAVDRMVPGEYATIQAAVNAASSGDHVVLADGVYTGSGNRDIQINKPLTIRSESGLPEQCIIDCAQSGRGFLVFNASAYFQGMTIQNSLALTREAFYRGAAIYSLNSDTRIRHCRFSNNRASLYGGAICTEYGSLHVVDSLFTGNNTDTEGGAIHSSTTPITLSGCRFENNSTRQYGGAVSCTQVSTLNAVNCVFVLNISEGSGGAVYLTSSGGTLSQCTFAEDCGCGNYGEAVATYDSQGTTLANCILWPGTGEAVAKALRVTGGNVTVKNSILKNGFASTNATDGGGNLTTTPGFVRHPMTLSITDTGDLHLKTDSPAVNTGSDALLPADSLDLDGDGNTTEPLPYDIEGNPRLRITHVDMGAYELQGRAPFATLAGAALRFDGINDRVTQPGFGTIAPTDEITIEFWQKADAVRNQSTLECNVGAGNTNRINVHVPWSDGRVYWDFGDLNAGSRLSYTPPVSIVGAWNHFAFVSSKSGNTMRIYRNGVLEASKVGYGTFTRLGAGLHIGGMTSAYSAPYAGELDDVRIWSRARTQTEIQADMRSPLQGDEPGLLLYYRFDEGKGLTIKDSSLSHRDGNLLDSSKWRPSGAGIDTITVILGLPRAVRLTSFDRDGLNPFYRIASAPAYGVITGSSPDFFYLSGVNFLDADQFTFTADNGTAESEPALVKVKLGIAPRTLGGTITLEECADLVQPITFTFLPSDDTPIITRNVTLDSGGGFQLPYLPAKSYNVLLKGEKWLAVTRSVNLTAGNLTNLTAQLLTGDANNDNSVDVLDLDALIQAFDSVEGDPNWNGGAADFNCDGSVDVLDLSLLILNFDKAGDS